MNYKVVREVLGRKRTVEILEFLSDNGTQNYSEIEDRFDTSSDTITDTLAILTAQELVERTERSKKDVRYNITTKGSELLELTKEINELLNNESDSS
jgi:DNA-binding HxlR family transcriptional regulator